MSEDCHDELPACFRGLQKEPCEGPVQQLDRGETPSLKGEVYRTTAEDSEGDHAKARGDQLEAGHQNLLWKKNISELQQFSEEPKPEDEDQMLGDVNTLNSSVDGDHHDPAETVQSSVLRPKDLTQQITDGTEKHWMIVSL